MNIPTRREIIEEMRKKGIPIAAVLPIYYPRPLLRALHIHPMELWGIPGGDHSLGNKHFQAYTCSLALSATSFLLDERTRSSVDFILIPHTCDTLQGMGSVFKDFIQPQQPVLTFYAPKNRSAKAFSYLIEELKHLAHSLESATKRSLDPAILAHEISLERKLNEHLRQLETHRQQYELSDRAFYTLLRSQEYLPPELLLEIVQELPQAQHHHEDVSLMLSGIVPEPMEIFDHLNEAGASVVADDLACCSRRFFQDWQDDESSDPFERLAKMMMSFPPAPTIGTPIKMRLERLLKTMKQRNIRGFLMYGTKFCEPELFELPLLRKKLTEEGYSFLYVESELDGTLSHQNLTRIEAFVESLS